MHIKFSTMDAEMAHDQRIMLKIERNQVLKQLEMLTMFFPDVMLGHGADGSTTRNSFVGVILYIDVLGIIALSEKYDKVAKGGMNVFLKTLNYCFGSIIETITFYGGDVIKYTGDTFIAMWKVMPESSLGEDIHACIMCGLFIQEMFLKLSTPMHIRLKVKIVISCGNIQCSIIGNENTKAFAISGDSLKGLKTFMEGIDYGDILISNAAWSRLTKEHYDCTKTVGGVKLVRVIYNVDEAQQKAEYAKKYVQCMRYVDAHRAHYTSDETNKLRHNNELLKQIPPRQAIKLVCKNWTVNELLSFIVLPVSEYLQQWQPIEYLSAKHVLTLQATSIVFKEGTDSTLPAQFINEIFQNVCDEVQSGLGVVTKFSLIENEMVVLALFGLRGANREMDSLNALRSGFKIYRSSKSQPEVESCSICVTYGSVFCGVVGHPTRKEYIVLGELVNKTRMVQKLHKNMVTCDFKTFTFSKLASFYFTVTDRHCHQSFEDFQFVFEYSEEDMKNTDDKQPSLIGREGVYNVLRILIFFPEQIKMYYGICLHGLRGIGKTTILKRLNYDLKKSNLVHASVELIAPCKLPYFTASKIYNQIYDQISSIKEDDDIDIILNLPRNLWDLHKEALKNEEDISRQKYRILNYFRDLIICGADGQVVVLLIDNIEYIDLQSWEILVITLTDGYLRLVCSATFTKENWDLKFQMSINENIKLYEIPRLREDCLAAFVCDALNVVGVSKNLADLVATNCDGIPSLMCGLLLKLINRNKFLFKLVPNHSKSSNLEFVKNNFGADDLVIVCVLTESGRGSLHQSVAPNIAIEIFESYELFIQMIIKTASILGDLFSRTLLTVALKYPSEQKLSKALQKLFEEEIFECGSRYIYSEGMSGEKICCRCHFQANFFKTRTAFPRYAYCRLIYFRRSDLRETCYDLFPENHRKELHRIASNYIEKSITLCCFCMKNPAYRFIYFHRFKYVINTLLKEGNNRGESVDEDKDKNFEIKETVRKSMAKGNVPFEATEVIDAAPIYDPRQCNCFEMCIRAYQDIIYHCSRSDMLTKEAFFCTLTGIGLVILRDVEAAKPILEKAALICTSDVEVPKSMRHFLMGRIELCLSKIAMALQRFNECKSHLAIALRQYNIPSVAIYYKPFKRLLVRTHLVKNKASMKQYVYTKNVLIRYDMACCLCFAAKVLLAEGHMNFAKLSTAYSLHLFKSVNPNVPILIDIYSTGTFVYKQSENFNTLIKMHKLTLKQLQQTYASGLTYVLFSIGVLFENMFLIYYKMAHFENAIRIGYRIFDMNQRFFTRISEPETLAIMSFLLVDTFRVIEAANLLHSIKANLQLFGFTKNVHVFLNVAIFLRCSLELDPVDESIVHFAHFISSIPTVAMNENTIKFGIVLQVYYIRTGRIEEALKIDFEADWNYYVKRSAMFQWPYLLRIEVYLSFLIHERRSQQANEALDKKIGEMLTYVKEIIKKDNLILLPTYLLMKAWYAKVKGNNRKSKKFLKEADQLAAKQGNILVQACVIKSRNCWFAGYNFDFANRPKIDYRVVSEYSVAEWADTLYAYPIE